MSYKSGVKLERLSPKSIKVTLRFDFDNEVECDKHVKDQIRRHDLKREEKSGGGTGYPFSLAVYTGGLDVLTGKAIKQDSISRKNTKDVSA